MDPGPRSIEEPLTPWRRALLAWMLITLLETLHGIVRELFIAPVLGDLHARQVGVLVGCVLIFGIALLTVRWIGALGRGAWLSIGALWVGLTLTFEFAMGRALGYDWQRTLSDYNPARGGFMAFGMVFLWVAPLVAAKLRGLESGANA
jgi:hypothetical protein